MPSSASSAHHAGHVVVEVEVVATRPFHVDFSRARVQHRVGAAATHPLDDAAGVADEDLVLVEVAGALEVFQRGANRRVEMRLVDGDTVPGAEATIALALERRAGINQREVDVEEHGVGAPRGVGSRHAVESARNIP